MIITTEEEYIKIQNSSLLVGKTLGEVAKHLCPGVTSKFLDQIAERFIRSHGAIPAFKGYRGYPATLCISINDVVVHGIPDDVELKEGDLVSIDCGVLLEGFYADYAYTFLVGQVDQQKKLLALRTLESLYRGIAQAKTGNTTGDIGYAIQQYVEKHGFSVVRDLIGHGIGKNLHEKPEVPNFGKKGSGTILQDGMVLCIEPMINAGKKDVYQDKDGWTIRTKDGKPSAHFEHMVIVRKDTPQVISTYEYIEQSIKNNIWLNSLQ